MLTPTKQNSETLLKKLDEAIKRAELVIESDTKSTGSKKRMLQKPEQARPREWSTKEC